MQGQITLVNWQDYIHGDPEILNGKPVIRGTRLSLDFMLRLFAAGWTEEQVLQEYPGLEVEELQAVFAFAADCMGDDQVLVLASNRGQ